MIVCSAFCRRKDERKLRLLCKKDSKQLTAAKRQEIHDKLQKFVDFRWVEISAAELSILMKDMSLNDIEAKAMAGLAGKLKDADIMIDMPDRYSWTFRERMEKFGATRFEAQHKADENYPIVAAASICAKLVRDRRVREIAAETSCEFGSGYSSDSRTIAALKDRDSMKKLSQFVRHRWKTLDNIKQRKLFETEEGAGGMPGNGKGNNQK